MKKYEIFPSEGGFRVCGGVWADSPIMDISPWYATQDEAQKASRKMYFDDCSAGIGLFEDFPGSWVLSLEGEFYNVDRPEGVKMARNTLLNLGFTSTEIDIWRPDLGGN